MGFTKNEGSLEYYLQRDRVSNRHSIDEKISFLIRPFLREEASEEIIASAIKYSYFSQNRSRIEIDKNDFNTEYINLKSVGNEIKNHGVVQKQERYELKTGEQEDNRIFTEVFVFKNQNLNKNTLKFIKIERKVCFIKKNFKLIIEIAF